VDDNARGVQDADRPGFQRSGQAAAGVTLEVADRFPTPRALACRLHRLSRRAHGKAAVAAVESVGEPVHGRQRPEPFHDCGG
jgi:hypothetical protein